MSYETKYECGEQLGDFSQVSVGEKVIHKESGELYEVTGLLWSKDAIEGNVLRFKNCLANYPIVQYCRAVPVKEQFEWVFENVDQTPFKDLSAGEMKLIVDAFASYEQIVEELTPREGWKPMEECATHVSRVYRVKCKVVETPLGIPWGYIKDNFKYATMDGDGAVWVYVGSPVLGSEHWFGDNGIELKAINIPTEGINWKYSLTKRPSTVGA